MNKEVSVDLKWSLWNTCREDWVYYGYGYEYSLLMDAFNQEVELELSTAPRKEIRFGEISIKHGTVSVSFRFEWDDPHELATGWGDERDKVPASEHARWLEYNGFSGASYCIEDKFDTEGMTFDEMMNRIDSLEDQLLQIEDRLSAEHDLWMKAYLQDCRWERLRCSE
jgi:hypothetical protein